MRVNRRGVLATWVAGALLLPLGVLTAGPAAAAPETPDLPTINITLPAGVTQSTLDGGSKDTVYTPTTIGTEDGSGTTYAADDLATVGPVAGEIKGRGNYTWKLAKKPYQIKLDKSRPLLGLPAAKTWVLLANHADASLMRNKLAFDFANSIGMPFSSESRWVDLRINGVYRGNYLLTEKVEVKTNRVELTDAQGVLAELDNNYGTAEDFWFTSGTSKTIFTLKDAKSGVPDPTKGESMSDVAYATTTKVGWDDMKSTINQLDSLLAASTPNWTAISALIDLDSFVKYYFVNELTENPEITSSSIYFYKNGTADKLHAGPVWDYDSAVGNYDKSEKLGAITYSSYTKNAQILRAKGNGWYYQLYRSPQFVQRANALWNSGIAYQANRLPTKIDGYKTQVQASAANNFAKWKILGTPTLLVAGEGKTYATTYSGEVAYLRDWVSKRSAHLQKEYGTVPTAKYQSHVASKGWLPFVNGGQISGTVGEARRLEAFNLSLLNSTGVTGSVTGNSHVQSIGWSGFKSTSLVGTTGKGLRLEAFQLKLTGNLALKYDIQYRAHVQSIGWQGWKINGATAGTTGQALRIEAVQIRLLHKTPPTPVVGP